MIQKGFVAVFELDEIVPVVLPVELVTSNGRIGFRGDIDVYMECNYMSIEVQWKYNFNYTLTYVNTATTALIEFSCQTIYSVNLLGYAQVTVDGGPTTNFYNGTYLYGTPLTGGETIQATSTEQIIVTLIV